MADPVWPADTAPVVIKGPDNWEIWGKLIKTWATGEDRVTGHVPNPFPIPQSVEEMKNQMRAAGIPEITPTNTTGFHIPARIKAVHFAPYNNEVLVLKLATKKMIEDGEAMVQALPNYPLPDFYDEIYPQPLPVLTQAQRERLHNERVGDYTIRACA